MWDFLQGTRVLDLSRLLPGPYAGLLLADLGAEVIKIEAPGGGDPMRAIPPLVGNRSYPFALFNRNKRSVALNLKAAEGRAILLRLVERGDALLETFRPGVAERLGVGYEAVRRANPKIVYCSLSGYGQTGPYRDRAGHDLNYAGVAGLLSLTGREKPELPGVPVADLAGGMYAALTMVAALQRQARTGEGAYLDVALTDSVFSWLSIHLADFFATGDVPAPGGTLLLGAYPCYAIYETSDGRHLTVAALEEKFWRNLCAALERLDYVSYQYDGQKREEMFADLRAQFKSRTLADWLAFFAELEVPVGPVNDLAEALADPQLRHRQLVRTVSDGESEWKQMGFPARFGNAREEADRPAPALGQHTQEVLGSLGYPSDQMKELKSRGVIAY